LIESQRWMALTRRTCAVSSLFGRLEDRFGHPGRAKFRKTANTHNRIKAEHTFASKTDLKPN
jgi:hypothetical protein